MMTEQAEQYETISSLNDLKFLYSKDTGLDAVTNFIERCEKNGSLAELDKLKQLDHKAYVDTLKSITDMVASGKLDPSDLSTITRGISLNLEDKLGASETERLYGDSASASWTNFKITLNKKLFSKDSEGNYGCDIGQVIGHEISHSIIELDKLDQIELPDKIMALIQDTDTRFESKHIQTCAKNRLEPRTLSIERLADLFGLYISSSSGEDFAIKKAGMMTNEQWETNFGVVPTSQEEIAALMQNEKCKDMAKTFWKQYRTINAFWPHIKEQLKSIDLDTIEDSTFLDSTTDEVELGYEKAEPQTSNLAAEFGTPQSNQQITKTGNAQKQTTSYQETADLGKKNNKTSGLLGFIGSFFTSFGKSATEGN